MSKEKSTESLEEYANRDYKYGFTSNIDTELIPKGLKEDTIRLISSKKEEPKFKADYSMGEFYSVAVTNNLQQANIGNKMWHIDKKHWQHHHFQRNLNWPKQ